MSNTRSNVNDEIFLATTALEEFWDTKKPIVFLGEWCLLYSRCSFWKPLNGQLLKSPFDNSEAVHTAYHYVDGIYEKALPIITSALNTLHGTCYSQRYWRILLGPWLMNYLPAIYDRYIHLKHALEQYPDCTTVVLAESSFIVPSDTADFVSRVIKEDSFNLQIYTKILSVLGKTFPCKAASIKQNLLYHKTGKRSWQRVAMDFLIKIYLWVGTKLSPSIVLNQSYFPRPIEIWFLIKTLGKVFPILPRLSKGPLHSCKSDIRNQLPKMTIGHSEFEQCLSAMLFADIPVCFVEDFCKVKNKAQNTYPKTPKVIFSANAWYGEEAFKQWVATSAENGTLLIGTAHGGAYGGWADFPSENHETSIADLYYSWGWERTDCTAKVVPFPATKLVGRKKIGASNQKVGILWAATQGKRYLSQLPYLPKYFQEYLEWQHRFAKSLAPEVLPAVRFRPHREDNGWNVIQRLNECIPNMSIEAWNVPFQKSLVNCRLYVCDHMSTTYTEALAANKPTVLFWNSHTNKLRPEALPYYDLLRKSGILFDTPESAGEAVNHIYDDVETWWNNPERQNAIEVFCERFARNSPDALDLWATEFNKIA